MATADAFKRLYGRRGEPVVVFRKGGVFDPTTSKVTGTTGAQTFRTQGVRLNFRHDQVDGVTIQRTDELVKFSALDATFDARAGDIVQTGSTDRWIVQNVRRKRRDGVVIAYELHIRASRG